MSQAIRRQFVAAADVLDSDGRGRILGTVATGWFLVLGTRLTVPALLPHIKAEYGITNSTAGFVLTGMLLVYAAMQLPGGIISDLWGERTTMLIGVAIGGVSVFGFFIAPTFLVFLLAAVGFGLGTGLFAPPRIILLARVFSENSGAAIGILFAAGSVGSVLLPAIGGLIAPRYGWQLGLGITLPVFVLLAVSLYVIRPPGIDNESSALDESVAHGIRRLASDLTDRLVLLPGIAITILFFVYQGLTTFLPTYLVATKGVTTSTAALIFSAFFLTGIVVQPAAGYIADRFGYRATLVGLSVFSAGTLVSLPLVEGTIPLVILSLLLGVRAGLAPVNNTYIVSKLSGDTQGVGYGLLRTIYVSIGATGSIFVGVLADSGLFHESFVVLGLLTLVAGGLFATLE